MFLSQKKDGNNNVQNKQKQNSNQVNKSETIPDKNQKNNENMEEEQNVEKNEQETQEQYLTRSVWEKNYKKRIQQIHQDANADYNVTISKIQNFSEENNKIAQQIVRTFQDESQHMVNVLDESIQIVLKDLLDNHIAIMNFTELFVFSRFEYYEKKIQISKNKINELIEYTEPPLSICETYVQCDYCTKIPSCIWCTSTQQCIPGNSIDGAFFQVCPFFMHQFCNRNAQKIDPESQMITPGTRIKERNPLTSNLVNPAQQQYIIEEQNKIIKAKNNIETNREKILKLQIFYYKLKQSQILIQRQYKILELQKELNKEKISKENNLFGDGEVWDGETEYYRDGEFWVETLPSVTEEEEENPYEEDIYYEQQYQQKNNQYHNQQQKQQIETLEQENEARFDKEENKKQHLNKNKSDKNSKKQDSQNEQQQQVKDENLDYLLNHEGDAIDLDLDEIEDEEQQILDFIADDLYDQEQENFEDF